MTEMIEEKATIDAVGILAKKSMIATLNISTWSARKTDKAITRELATAKNAKNDAIRVSKAIINKTALTRIKEIITKLRKYHNTVTLPWNNDGGRLLPTTKHAEYTTFYRKSLREFEDAVLDFVNEYNNYIAEASQFLGDMYNSDDYPSAFEIKKKFNIDLSFAKVPEAADFRVDIPQYEQDKIARQIEERVEHQHAESMRRVWNRMYKTVEHVYERLQDEDAIFRDSLIKNVQELVELLPDLNILKDQNLEDMAVELKNTLCSHDPDTLRKDKDQRKQVAEDSKDLLEKIGQYFQTDQNDTDIETDEENVDNDEEDIDEDWSEENAEMTEEVS